MYVNLTQEKGLYMSKVGSSPASYAEILVSNIVRQPHFFFMFLLWFSLVLATCGILPHIRQVILEPGLYLQYSDRPRAE